MPCNSFLVSFISFLFFKNSRVVSVLKFGGISLNALLAQVSEVLIKISEFETFIVEQLVGNYTNSYLVGTSLDHF